MDKFAAKVRIVKGWYEKRVVKAGWGVERGSGRLRGYEGDGEMGGLSGGVPEGGVSRDGGGAMVTHDGNALGDLNLDMWAGLDEPDGWMDWCRDWDGEMGFVGGGS
ncbi:hypothetical protein CJF30_00001441 [Rutstroemia sp. NJR-2017a BBW]|nr:hypothetical protein CJF30_00001441 [Rutstroemia sp. NJR-2017a BBW]